MGGSKSPHVDEMVFYVATTRAKVERYLKDRGVMPYSWWKVQSYRVNVDDEESAKTFLYSHTGKRIKSAPESVAKYHYLRYCKQNGW